MMRKTKTWRSGILSTIAFFMAVVAVADDAPFAHFDFETDADGWRTYLSGEITSELSVSSDEAFAGNYSLKVQTPGKVGWQGPGKDVAVAPERAYIISGKVKGDGQLVLAVNGNGGWCYSMPLKLDPVKWQTIKVRRYEKSDKFSFYFATYDGKSVGQKVTYYVDDVRVEQEPLPTFPERTLKRLRHEAEDFPGNSEIVADPDASGGAYVERKERYNNWLAVMPFPETSKPVFIYFRGWLGGDEKNKFHIVHGSKQQAESRQLPELGKWHWVKMGPFLRKQIGTEFSISAGGGVNVEARLDTVLLSTEDGLREEDLEPPPWLRERVGIEALSDDCVLPPFTPVKVDKDREIEVWNRRYHLSDLGLPATVETAGASVLSAPAELQLHSGGQEIRLQSQGKLEAAKIAKGAVEYLGTTESPQLNLTLKTRIEYDGIILYELHLQPHQQLEIDRLTFTLPLKNEYAPYLWAGGNSQEKTKDVPKIVEENYAQVLNGDGVLWSRPFREMVWLGDDERGLLWFCQTEENWYPQEYSDRPDAVQVVRDGGATNLQIQFISKAKTFSQPVKYTFGIMATPVRPRPEGWRGWRFTLRNGVFRIGLKEAYKGNMLLYWPGGLWRKYNLSPLIKDKDEYLQSAVADHAEGRTVLPYLAPICIGAGIYEAETENGAKSFSWSKSSSDSGRWLEKNPVYDLYRDAWEIHPVKTGKSISGNQVFPAHYVSQQSGYTDYVVWAMREHARCGADAIGILDGSSSPDTNRFHGAGYYDEAGKLRPTYTGLAQRTMNKRLLKMFIDVRGDKRKRLTGLGLDHTHARTGNVFCNSFYDAGLKGEELNSGYYRHSPEYREKMEKDDFYYANMLSLEEFRIAYTGKQWGWVPVFFAQLQKSPGISKEWANSPEGTRDYLVFTLLHDCLVYPSWSNARPIYETWLAKDKFGIADDEVEFEPYWENEKFVSSSNDNVKISFYRKPGKLLIISANLAKTPCSSEIKLNLQAIGAIQKPTKIYDGTNDEPVVFQNSSLLLDFPPRDFKMVILE